jgi:transcriptional regulator with XRE-family HTH domain
VTERIAELHTTSAAVARSAGVSANTVRALAKGERWPHQDSRDRIAQALGWHPGDLAQRALDGELASLSTVDLLMEVVRRVRCIEGAT